MPFVSPFDKHEKGPTGDRKHAWSDGNKKFPEIQKGLCVRAQRFS